jgi:hypothetical protein
LPSNWQPRFDLDTVASRSFEELDQSLALPLGGLFSTDVSSNGVDLQ